MTKKKYYAVRVGRKSGIYTAWSQAEAQVKGFPGAQFKSFPSEEEARRYMAAGDAPDETMDTTEKANASIETQIGNLSDREVIAFVDGSYFSEVKGREKYSFGAVLITREGEHHLCGAFSDEDKLESRQVAGEIEGVKQAILWAVQNKKEEIRIFYDYAGIERWARKEWKTNKPLTRQYAEFIEEHEKKIKISFCHTKAHTGILYNEKADELAKSAFADSRP